jgi:ABC-type glycerol-3-phosphate transport system substrate-binding protein
VRKNLDRRAFFLVTAGESPQGTEKLKRSQNLVICMKPTYLTFLLLLALFLASCTVPPAPEGTLPPGVTPVTPPGGEGADLTATPPPTEEVSLTPTGDVTLHLWVPPEFDPQAGTPGAALLQARLDEFAALQPGVQVEVRVKALDGTGGLLDSLTTASAAAPQAVPDLIALPRPKLETAAIKGLLQPLDPLTSAPDEEDFYDFARELSRVGNSIFGLPFAGDALVLVYRPTVAGDPTPDWESALEASGPLLFPAADLQALVTLTLYRASGGAILDEQGRPTLEVNPLMEVLAFYQQAAQADLIPSDLPIRESDETTWEAYRDRQAHQVITWVSRYLKSPPADSVAAPVPTADGTPYTSATGWAWALASVGGERQVLSVQLAEFLTDSEFLAAWTSAAGYIPTRPAALAAWENTPLQALVSQIVPSAELIPSTDVLATIGPVLQQAALSVLEGSAVPAGAAQSAVERLINP